MKNNEVVHIKESKTEKSIVHKKDILSAQNFEDFVSSLGVILVSAAFILYVAFLSLSPPDLLSSKDKDPQGRGFGNQKTNAIFPIFTKQTDCKKMNGDYEACVRSQSQGSGCSWYADCRVCILGSHEGRKREEMCGNN